MFSPNVLTATLQQYFPLRATFRPTECRIERASYLPRAVLRGDDIRTRSRSPLRCPVGIVVLFPQSGPALSNGTGEFRRSSRGPQRGEGVGKCAGANDGRSLPENQHRPRGNKATTRVCCRSASRPIRQGCKRRVRPATHCKVRNPSQYRRATGAQRRKHQLVNWSCRTPGRTNSFGPSNFDPRIASGSQPIFPFPRPT